MKNKHELDVHDDIGLLGSNSGGIPFDDAVRRCCMCGKKLSRYNLNDHCFACTPLYIEKVVDQREEEVRERKSAEARRCRYHKINREFLKELAQATGVSLEELTFCLFKEVS